MAEKDPNSLMMSHGYDPHEFLGSIKAPIFQTSTFSFKTAEEGKAFFEVAYGKRELKPGEKTGYIYSRLNNPNLQIVEDRLKLWDGGEDAAVFESGMAAISTVFLELLRPGDLLVYNTSIYGGTDYFIKTILPRFQINTLGFHPSASKAEIIEGIKASGHAEKLSLIYLETPANPNNTLVDISMYREVAAAISKEIKIPIAVDNTYMGPLWQHPIKNGADLVLYSATKYLAGHSDLVSGACLGSYALLKRIKKFRSATGNAASPQSAWLLARSLETVQVRMNAQAENAKKIAQFLSDHPNVVKVYYLGFLEPGSTQKAIFDAQCFSPGAMISFDIVGGEKEAFKFLNQLKVIKLAVSLGSTESLAQHPATMTHSDVSAVEKEKLGIGESLIRLSIGIENQDDLTNDLAQALR